MLAATAALAFAAILVLVRLPVFSLREVTLAAAPARVSVAQLEYVARTAVQGNFFTVDLERVRRAFETLPWVRHASLRRRWPATLELAIEEHRAVAIWGRGADEGRLLNDAGEVFVATTETPLPRLGGPEGSAGEMLTRYREFSQALAPLGRAPRSVTLSPRLAWRITLDDGFVIELGRDQQKSPLAMRLARFVASYGATQAQLPAGAAVADLRYPNGYSLRPAGLAEGKSTR
jgi:cell division protein FtsQ